MKSTDEKTEVKHYVIFSYTDCMYFSTSKGWTSFNEATIFTQLQRDSYELPISCSYWIEVVEDTPKPKNVVIDIYAGVANVRECPDDVWVEILYHDTENYLTE
jgi:hypothetical protein